MKVQRDKLKQYRKKIAVVADRETEVARKCLAAGQKDKALLALRRKKYQQSLVDQTDAQLEQLEKLTANVEFSLVQKDVLFGLQRGTEVLKQINTEMGGLAAVERMMEDSAEARRQQEEISEALSGQLSNAEEDDVEDELEALEREVVGVKDDIKLPTAPQGSVLVEGDLPEAPQETELEREHRRKERAKQRRAQLEAA